MIPNQPCTAADGRSPYEKLDPTEGLSAASFAKRLGIAEQEVRNREKAGELFSIVRPSRASAREYPAFQAWEGIFGEPLRRLLAALRHPSGPEAYGFFTAPHDTLGGLSPIEAILGFAYKGVPGCETECFLAQPPNERLSAVVEAAQTYADSLDSW